MAYEFKPYQEAGYAAVTAVTIFVLETGVNFDPSVITDWSAWGLALAGAGTRAVSAAALNAFLRYAGSVVSGVLSVFRG